VQRIGPRSGRKAKGHAAVTDVLCDVGVVAAAEACIGTDAPSRSVEVPTATIMSLIRGLQVARCRRTSAVDVKDRMVFLTFLSSNGKTIDRCLRRIALVVNDCALHTGPVTAITTLRTEVTLR
jgi:hypothetical protein